MFSTCSDLLASLPPPPRLPDDDVWQVGILRIQLLTAKKYLTDPKVLVTTIECISRVTIRLLGETWAGRLDSLLGDMDLHYFQVNPTRLGTFFEALAHRTTVHYQQLRLAKCTQPKLPPNGIEFASSPWPTTPASASSSTMGTRTPSLLSTSET